MKYYFFNRKKEIQTNKEQIKQEEKENEKSKKKLKKLKEKNK